MSKRLSKGVKQKGVTVSLALTLALGSTILPQNVDATSIKSEKVDKKQDQLKVLHKFEKMKGKEGLKVSWDKKRGVPDFVSGKLSDKKVKSKSDVKSYLNDQRELFNLNAGDFDIIDVNQDELGMTHYKTQLKVDGIPVYGAELSVHTNQDGNVVAMNGQVEPKLEQIQWNKKVKLSEKKAIKKAEKILDFKPNKNTYTSKPTADLYLYESGDNWMPVYLVELQFIDPKPGREFVFVSATNGEVIHHYDALHTATGTGVDVNGDTRTINTLYSGGQYTLYDDTKAMSGVIRTYTANNGTSLPGSDVTDSDNNYNASNQAAAVSAHYNAGVTYDYFYNTHNRNSYDGNGSDIISTVHYSTNYNNAFWNGSQMVYGDGDGSTFTELSGSLDVVAHELTHAVTENTANLVYANQSGALNESFSDVFGVIVEAENGDFDWLLGEDVYTPGTPGDALRSISSPSQYGQPEHMNDYQNLPNTEEGDWGGVHTNSGIPNKAFYNIATDIGLDKSGDIYYRALSSYLTSQSDFDDARSALLQAATDLYGSSSPEYQAVDDGFAAVGIGGTSSGDTYEANDTLATAHGPIASGTTYNSYIWSSSDVDYFKFDAVDSGNISVSLSNLPGDYDVYLYNSAGSLLAQSENGGTTSESISYSATGAGTFYVKVVGYNGASSTSTAYALNVTYPTGSQSTAQWYYETASADTPHPYPNNYNSGHTYSKPGAQQVAIHFSRFETEAGYDFVYVKDKNGTVIEQHDGVKSAFWVIVDGDEITVTLDSDSSVTDYGYHIDEVAYFNDQPLLKGTNKIVQDEKAETTSSSPIE
ncbi:M4 family metallopeptidase [Pseudalkalibacillus berkeleyi]|uniref:M4 family metallopeptidase n=1 Tax=Pseudalkalibacillus berkeleyi TaxID=1069813 RepID=A0ABS9GXJ0_9BACL|nr:M4 family metallopeptidase [Pseudalkalibacillus berkeleyi]MCF6137488.1 M4 family metallopeptidase [Pseudalkalibacillus berkeleyi]